MIKSFVAHDFLKIYISLNLNASILKMLHSETTLKELDLLEQMVSNAQLFKSNQIITITEILKSYDETLGKGILF